LTSPREFQIDSGRLRIDADFGFEHVTSDSTETIGSAVLKKIGGSGITRHATENNTSTKNPSISI